LVCRVVCLWFFFFQAEDGIRDLTVTGVQTCALPISRLAGRTRRGARRARRRRTRRDGARRAVATSRGDRRVGGRCEGAPRGGKRSEERRVGKGGRAGWSREQLKTKMEEKRVIVIYRV